jgi:hypothetical protein
MSALGLVSREGAERAADLMAETELAMEDKARQYAELATRMRESLQEGQIQRQAAWCGDEIGAEHQPLLVTA